MNNCRGAETGGILAVSLSGAAQRMLLRSTLHRSRAAAEQQTEVVEQNLKAAGSVYRGSPDGAVPLVFLGVSLTADRRRAPLAVFRKRLAMVRALKKRRRAGRAVKLK